MDLYSKLGQTGGIYLTSQTQSYVAINIYKKFGFCAYMGELHGEDFDRAEHEEAWKIIDEKISEYKHK